MVCTYGRARFKSPGSPASIAVSERPDLNPVDLTSNKSTILAGRSLAELCSFERLDYATSPRVVSRCPV